MSRIKKLFDEKESELVGIKMHFMTHENGKKVCAFLAPGVGTFEIDENGVIIKGGYYNETIGFIPFSAILELEFEYYVTEEKKKEMEALEEKLKEK